MTAPRTATLLDEQRVRDLLNQVIDPCSAARHVPIGLGDMGLVRSVAVRPGRAGVQVEVTLRVTGPGCIMFPDLERQARDLLLAEGAAVVTVTWEQTFDWSPEDIAPEARHRLDERRRLIIEQRQPR